MTVPIRKRPRRDRFFRVTLSWLLAFGFCPSQALLRPQVQAQVESSAASEGAAESDATALAPSLGEVHLLLTARDEPSIGSVPPWVQEPQTGEGGRQAEPSQAQPQEKQAKKEKRGSIVAAPIPISSPAIGSGGVIVGGYIFPLQKSDKVSQPSTIGGAVLITDNGSRGWGLGGDFYFKQDT